MTIDKESFKVLKKIKWKGKTLLHITLYPEIQKQTNNTFFLMQSKKAILSVTQIISDHHK